MNRNLHFNECEQFYSATSPAPPLFHSPDGTPYFEWEMTADGSGVFHPKHELVTAFPPFPKQSATKPNKSLDNVSSASQVGSKRRRINSRMGSTEEKPSGKGDAEVPEYSFHKELIGATRDFIRQKITNPEFYGTLTYWNEVREAPAKRISRRYLSKVAQLYGIHLRVAWAEEYQGRGVFHHHFLFEPIRTGAALALPHVEASDLSQLWGRGSSEIEKYDPQLSDPYHGAALYLAKHDQWSLEVACPRLRVCRREDGCKVARLIW